MKYIFLDIDGPLLTHNYLVKQVKDNGGINLEEF